MCARILALLEKDEQSPQVKNSLLQSGHHIVLTRTFNEAIAALKDLHFNLIISDVHLENGGSVFDFLKWVKTNAATNKIPFVLLSTKPTPLVKYLEDGVRTAARSLGAEQYIAMDHFNADHFLRQIDSFLPKSGEAIEVNTATLNDTPTNNW